MVESKSLYLTYIGIQILAMRNQVEKVITK